MHFDFVEILSKLKYEYFNVKICMHLKESGLNLYLSARFPNNAYQTYFFRAFFHTLTFSIEI